LVAGVLAYSMGIGTTSSSNPNHSMIL